MKKNYKTNKTKTANSNSNMGIIRDYVRKKGFYIALFTLVAILTGSVFVTSYVKKSENIGSSFNDEAWKAAIAESEKKNSAYNSENTSSELTSDIKNSVSDSEKTSSADTANTENKTAVKSDSEEEADVQSKSSVSSVKTAIAEEDETEITAVSVSAENKKVQMDMPCIGGIIKDYSMDELVYSKTMDDWRTHSGIDIAASVGAQVKAAADGIVEQVYTDEMLGNVIVIDHGNEIKTLYGNLQSSDYIEVKRTIKKGDIIGGIGTSGSEEKADEPHLHFEVLKDGEPIKPEF